MCEILKQQLYVLRVIATHRPCAHLAFLFHAPYRAMYDNVGQNVQLAESLGEWVNLEQDRTIFTCSLIAFRFKHNRGALYFHPRVPCAVFFSMKAFEIGGQLEIQNYLCKFATYRAVRKTCKCKIENICGCKVHTDGAPLMSANFMKEEETDEEEIKPEVLKYVRVWKNITVRWNKEKGTKKKQMTMAEQMELSNLFTI